jgi:hypothetical protein
MKKNYLHSLFILLILGCSSAPVDPVKGERVLIEPNPNKRAKEFAEKGGGLFGDIGKRNDANKFDFATSNVLWKATLKSLDFLPLVNADYSGGVIIYDWYSDNSNSKEQIKISVKFLNNEIRSDSVQITAFKKICENLEKCFTQKLDSNFSNQIKETIISSARIMKIEETKQNNNKK